MFCTNCGAEIPNGARFCTHCGANVSDAGEISRVGTEGQFKSAVSILLGEGKDVIKMVFTKRPFLAVKKYAHEKSYIGIAMATICMLFFSFVSCINITQIINYGFSVAIDGLISLLSTYGDMGELYGFTSKNLGIEIPILYSLFGRLLLISILVFLCEFLLTYLVVRLRKQKPESLLNIFNIIGIAYMPIIIGGTISLVIGFFLPVLVIIVMISAIVAKLIFIYEGIKEIGMSENEPVWEFSLFVVVMCIAITLIGALFIKGSLEIIGQAFVNEFDSLSSNFSGLMNLF